MKTHPKTNVIKINRLLKITLIEKNFVAEAFFSLKNIQESNGEKSGEFEYSPTALNDLGQVR